MDVPGSEAVTDQRTQGWNSPYCWKTPLPVLRTIQNFKPSKYIVWIHVSACSNCDIIWQSKKIFLYFQLPGLAEFRTLAENLNKNQLLKEFVKVHINKTTAVTQKSHCSSIRDSVPGGFNHLKTILTKAFNNYVRFYDGKYHLTREALSCRIPHKVNKSVFLTPARKILGKN